MVRIFGSITNITKDDVCEVSKSTVTSYTIVNLLQYKSSDISQNTCYNDKSLPESFTHIISMGTLKDQPQLQDDYWNLNITSKQFVGKDASGLKRFECDILCSHHKNISRLTGRSSSAKRGSKLIITGELEINESRLYCEVHHFEFVTQIGPKFEGLKRDSSIWR